MILFRRVSLFLLLSLIALPSHSQDPTVIPSSPIFTLDVKTYDTKGSFSYDKTFQLRLTSVDTTIIKINVNIYTGLTEGKGELVFQSSASITNSSNITLPILAKLHANHQYYFCIELLDRNNHMNGPIIYGFTLKTKMGDFIKLDLGLGYAPNIKGVVTHTAVHFYFMPVNDDVDIKTIDGISKNIFLRTSLFVGISPIALYSNTEQPIVNATSAGNVIFGVGIRSPFYGKHLPMGRNFGWVFLQPLRLNIGEIYFKQAAANPLIAKNRDKLSFYVGISYDVRIAGLLGPIGKLIKP